MWADKAAYDRAAADLMAASTRISRSSGTFGREMLEAAPAV